MKINKSWLAVRLERITKTSHLIQGYFPCSVAVMLLLTTVVSRAQAPEMDGGVPGPYPVGHTSFVSTYDAGRPVAVNVWYPADPQPITAQSPEAVYVMDPYTYVVGSTTSSQWEALGYDRAFESITPAGGPFPLIMFSPGLFLNGWNYLYFGTRLASHGYMVAVVEHFGDGFWLPVSDATFRPLAEVMYNRPRDLSFALTEMFRRDATSGDLLYKAIDRRYIVAAGHSLGGYAAMVEFSGDDQVCDADVVNDFGGDLPAAACQATPPDPRFTALLTLDGSEQGLRWEELSRIHVPSLIMGDAANADGDYLATDGPSWLTFVARPHAALAAGTRSLRVDIDNAEHLSFGSPCDGYEVLRKAHMWQQKDYRFYYTTAWGCGQLLPTMEPRRVITKYAVAWLNAEVVKNQSELSKRILTQAYTIAHEPTVELWWDEKCECEGDKQPGTFTYFIDMVPGTCAVGEKNPVDFFVPYPPSALAPSAKAMNQPMDPATAESVFKAMRRRL